MPEERRALGRTAYELQETIERNPGACSVCLVAGQALRRRIDAFFYEDVNDREQRETIRRARGFCRFHARLIAQHADALGTAIILRDVLTNDLRDLEGGDYALTPAGNPFARLRDGGRRLPPRAPCPLCTAEREQEEAVLDSLAEGLGDASFSRAFQRSAGLCLPHFRLAYTRFPPGDEWQIVLETEQRTLASLVDELRVMAEKYDYRAQHEERGEEMTSWRRALDVSAGLIEE